MKATAIGLPVEGEGWCRIEIGDEGVPHGVEGLRDATCVKCGSDCNPVPPMTAIETGSGERCRQPCVSY